MIDLFRISFSATSKFVSSHINNKKEREYYLKCSQEILTHTEGTNLKEMERFCRMKLKKSHYNDIGKSLFFDYRYNYLLACTHAIAIIHSLEERFL